MTFAALGPAGPRGSRILMDCMRYGLVSALALACDWGVLVALVAVGVEYLVAAAAGFCVGMAAAYALSVRFVFPRRRAVSREAEAGGFFAVGIVGLLLTLALLFLFVSRLGIPVALAKAPTAAMVFLFNALCRRGLLFAASARP